MSGTVSAEHCTNPQHASEVSRCGATRVCSPAQIATTSSSTARIKTAGARCDVPIISTATVRYQALEVKDLTSGLTARPCRPFYYYYVKSKSFGLLVWVASCPFGLERSGFPHTGLLRHALDPIMYWPR